jgi:predicted ATPase
MIKIVGFSGAQGAGKSTLLNALRDDFVVDDFKVSRAVQKEQGCTLEDAVQSWDKMVVFQTSILYQKYLHDSELLKQPGDSIILVERTFADIYAYTALWCKRLVAKSLVEPEVAESFLTGYLVACRKYQDKLYSLLFVIPLMDHIPREVDAHRADYASAMEVYNTISTFTIKGNVPYDTITGVTVQERAERVKEIITQL